ncbi:MFS transporter [Chitinophaga alhagiae]|uniref:MFS transporter n=1 Tax=Chitinophaga alhagiae TaxID=2203219 RepID=UPI000E5B7FE1|nr:MFS transporter [Chitinophaga alhagiae]
MQQADTLKRRWYRLIPVVFVTYSLAYLDRANFGFAAAGGMAEDLGISAATLSLLSALFFLGYFIFQIPGAHYASGKSAKKLIFWSLILWGALATATGFVSNVTLLICIRFTLGVMESAVIPAMLILLSRWFTKHERSRANSFLILGNPVTMLWMSILSGYLIDWIGWRGMFIIEGAPAVLWAFIWWKQIEDSPEKAAWLSEEDKKLLREKLLQEQEDIKPVKNYLTAFRSREVILLSLQLALWSIGTYGFMMWLPSVLKTAPGISIVEAGWLSSLAYGVAIIGMIGISYFSDRSLKRKPYVTGALLTASLAFLGLFLAKPDNFWLSYCMLVIAGGALCAPFGPFFALIAEILPRNVLGVSIALVNSVGALGSFVGAYLVGYLNGLTGSFTYAFLLMSVAMFLAAVIMKFGIKFEPRPEAGPEQYSTKRPAFGNR